MSNFKEKIPTFLLGSLFGLVIAGSFFILKLDDYFKELKVYKNIITSISSIGNKEDAAQEKETVKETIKKPTVLKNKLENKKLHNDSIIDKTDNHLSKENIILSDSAEARLEEDIDLVVKKDELIESVSLKVINVNTIKTKQESDSLAKVVGGIEENKEPSFKMMNIELWKSPLNFKGYKMSKNKVVLFGLGNFADIKLFELNDRVYLKLNNIVYLMALTSEFKNYVIIDDKTILSKLH